MAAPCIRYVLVAFVARPSWINMRQWKNVTQAMETRHKHNLPFITKTKVPAGKDFVGSIAGKRAHFSEITWKRHSLARSQQAGTGDAHHSYPNIKFTDRASLVNFWQTEMSLKKCCWDGTSWRGLYLPFRLPSFFLLSPASVREWWSINADRLLHSIHGIIKEAPLHLKDIQATAFKIMVKVVW